MAVEFPAISLARYAERIGYRECAFFGVNHPDNAQWECREIWSQAQRDMIAWALGEAQDEIEQEIDYFLTPRWVADERHAYDHRMLTRSNCYTVRPFLTRWGHVIAGGAMLDTVIASGVNVSYTADPATVAVNGVTCDVANIHVYPAGTAEEITPSAMTLVAGTLTISIPWCRLVDPAYQDNPETGWLYSDVATWGADTVDVHCVTNDPATQAKLIVAPGTICSDPPCTETQYDACLYVRQSEIGSIEVHRADYSAGTWTRKTLCYVPSWVELNYQAGLTTLTRQAEDTIIRLAHSKMADEPCGCDVTQRLWRRDRNVPQVLTRERINNPFGLADGSWIAWRFAQTMKLVRGAVL